MVTITERNSSSGNNAIMSMVASDPATVATSDIVDISDLPFQYPHCFLGIQMFDSGGDPIDAGAATGTFTIEVETVNTLVLESPPTATIDAAAPTTISWLGNTRRIKVTYAAGSGITTWRVIVTMNRS